MPNMPEGAQLSEDGYWWWDGSAWQPVQAQEEAAPQGQPAQGQPAQAQGEVTAAEIAAITSPDQITERYLPYFVPDYDAVADDASQAAGGGTLSDEPEPGWEEEDTDG